MESSARTNIMDGIYQILPKSSSPQLKKQLSALQEHMDGILFLDETNELAVDRDAFLAFINNSEFVPPEIKDYTAIETAKHLGRRMKGRKGRSLSWTEAANFGFPLNPEFSTFKKLNLNNANQEEAISALSRELPDLLTKEFLSQDSRAAVKLMLVNLKKNRTPWDCIVANLGFWAALGVIFVLAMAAILAASGVGFWLAVGLIAAFVGTYAAYLILQCMVDPGYNSG
jgi:hypothetical protein